VSRISVCLTYYDRPEKLVGTLESLARQTRRPDEVFLWDDCSPGRIDTVVANYRSRFPHFVYHRNERNLGMPGNLNAVVAQATGDYVANLHDADVYHPTLLEKWGAALDAHTTAGFVFCRVGGRNQGQERRLCGCPALVPGREFNRCYFLNSWRGSSPVWGTVMGRRELYLRALPFEQRFGCVADVDMWMRLSLMADVAFVDQALISIDADSHFVHGVNWDIVHALRRIHGENARRMAVATGHSAAFLRMGHWLALAPLYSLCVCSLLRHGRLRELGGILAPCEREAS